MGKNKLEKILLRKSFKRTIKEFDDFIIESCGLTRKKNLKSFN